jgi:hypothetical protein
MDNEFKAVIMHGFPQEQALAIMRAVKSLGFTGSATAFATTTPTNMEWKVADLIDHLEEEHDNIRKNVAKKG